MTKSATREKADGELFKSTGIDDNATSTAVTIDASENVGIGTASPDSETLLHVRKGDAGGVDSATNSVLTLENNTTAILQFLTPNTANGQIRFGDPQDTGSGYIQYSHSDSSLQFGTNGPEKMRIDSSGHAIIGGGVTLGNGQTYAAANTLDDYEEGTWTPVLKFDGNNVGMVFTGQGGFYTKVGNLVTANSYYSLSDKGSSNGAAQIHGLPFAVANVTNNYIPVSLGFSGVSFADMMIGYTALNTTYVNLREVSNAGAHTTIVQSNVANSGDMMMSVTYRTA